MPANGERKRGGEGTASRLNLLCSILAIVLMLLPVLVAPAKMAAAPVYQDNLDGTKSAVWTFDAAQDLTLENVTIGGGVARLDAFSDSWVQTTWIDFANGNGTNVSYFPEGSLSLAFDLNQERIVAASDRGGVYSIASNGTIQWIGNMMGKITHLDTYDSDGDGYDDDVIATQDGGNNPIAAFDEDGNRLWISNWSYGSNALRSFDQDRDGRVDEVVAGGLGGTLRVLNENGAISWSLDLIENIDSITIADLDLDGFANDIVVGLNGGAVVALNRTGQQLWTYPASGDVTHLATVQEPSSGYWCRTALLDAATNLILLNVTGKVLWSRPLGGAGAAVAAADFDDDGIMDDVAAGDGGGTIYSYDSDGVYRGGLTFNSVVDIASFNYNTIGGNEAIGVGYFGGNIKMLNETGFELRGWTSKSAVNAVTDARIDGDNYGDCAVGLNNGTVVAVSGSGATAWETDIGGAVNDVIRIRGKDSFKSSGSWESQIFDAGAPVAWGSLIWNSSIPDGANLTFATRSGSTPSPDVTWSGWSTPTWLSGTGIASPSGRYLQVRVELATLDTSRRPVLNDFAVSYGGYAPSGFLETDDIMPPDWVMWDVFNATVVEPVGTSIRFWSSANNGSSWIPLNIGVNLSATASPALRFKVDLATSDQNASPLLLEMSIAFEYLGPIDHIHVTPPSWSGTADSSLTFSAVAHDLYNRPVLVALKWKTSDPFGTVDSSGLYRPGRVGMWLVYANTTDDSISGYATVSVSSGSLARIGIVPWNPGSVVAGNNLTFNSFGYDQHGNMVGPVATMWSVSGEIGQIVPIGSATSSTLYATTVGVGIVGADDGAGHTDATAPITVTAAALSRIDLTPNPVNVFVDAMVAFTAKGFDSFGNPVLLSGSSWSTNAGTFVSTNDTSAILRAQATPVSGAFVRIAVGVVQGSATMNVVDIDRWPIITGVIPDQVKPEDFGGWVLDLSPYASDPRYPPTALHWELIGHNASLYSIQGLGIAGNHLLSFSTMLHAYGVNQVTLLLANPDGYNDSRNLWVNITFVNHPPVFDSIPPFTIHHDIAYNYYFHEYVHDIETPKEKLVLTSSDRTHVSIDGLWATFTYPKSMESPPPAYPIITVTDANGASASTVLIITISSDYVPTLTKPLPDVVLLEGQEIMNCFDLDEYFSDPEGDALYYNSGNTHVDIHINANHTVDFKAPRFWYGNETVMFSAIDPQAARAEDQILVTVLPVNDAPSISGVPDLHIRYDDPIYPDYNYTFDLSPYIVDMDDPPQVLVVTTTEPAHIRFFLPLNMVMSIHFPKSMNGMKLNVTIHVSDGRASGSQSISITITDDWPPELLTPIPDQVFWEDTALRNAFNVSTHFTDRDRDTLYFTYGNDSVLVYIDPATNMVDLSAKPDWFGAERVTFRATDPVGAIAEYTITVTVLPVDDSPVIASIPEITMVVGDIYILDLSQYVSDVDNAFHELSFAANGSVPSAVRIVGGYLIFAYNETGHYSVRLYVSDGNLTAWMDVSVVVATRPAPQVFGVWTLPFVLLSIVLLIIFCAIVVRRTLLKMVLEEALVIHSDGSLVAVESRPDRAKVIDEDLFSATLTIIQDFAKDSFKSMGDAPLKRLEFGKKKILLEKADAFCLAIVYSGFEKKSTVKTVSDTVKKINTEFGAILGKWDGLNESVEGISAHLKALWQ